jgi:L-histidine N-alpha-methyltransferase
VKAAAEPLVVDSYLSEREERSLAFDVLDGLTKPFKEIAPKHFYDGRGSELFDEICTLPEYYPTRAERAILDDRAAEIMERTGAVELVELGPGSPDKARILLAAGDVERYVPVEVSEAALRAGAEALVEEFAGLRVHGVVGDFERHLGKLPAPLAGPRVVAFLGGTIGNFPPGSRRRFLRQIRAVLRPGDWLLLGADLVKDPAVIEAAYNDSRGVTAEFNRNVLRVINRELAADFPVDAFEHVAFFDPRHEWVEMRLRATRPCSAWLAGLGVRIEFAAGEEMRTEISAKFTRRRLAADLRAAGLELRELLTDDADLFSLSLSTPATSGAEAR